MWRPCKTRWRSTSAKCSSDGAAVESKPRSIGSSAPVKRECPFRFSTKRAPTPRFGRCRRTRVHSSRSCTGIICGLRRPNSSNSRGWSRCADRERLELAFGAPIAQAWTSYTFTDARSPPLFASDLADRIPAGLYRLAFAARIGGRSLRCSRRRRAADRGMHRHSVGGPHSLLAAQGFADRMAWVGFIAMGFFSSLFVATLLRDLFLLVAHLRYPPGRRRRSTRRRRAGRSH